MKAARIWAFVAVFVVYATLQLPAQQWYFNDAIPGKHKGKVTALFFDGDTIASAGEDGFIEIWDIQKNAAKERFQVSPHAIQTMVKSPVKKEICLVETDGLNINRISAWNYSRWENLFSINFPDAVTYVNYSAAGNFIIAAHSGRDGLLFINSQTGEVIKSPETIDSSPSYAATGRSERSMLAYFPWGQLAYWDIESGDAIGSFNVDANLTSPVVFGNNRYLAGLDAKGLVVIDAVTGEQAGRSSLVSHNAFLCADADSVLCMTHNGTMAQAYQFSIDRSGRLLAKEVVSINESLSGITVMAAREQTIAIGTDDGKVIVFAGRTQKEPMRFIDQVPITACAVSGTTIAFLSSGHELGFLSLDYANFFDDDNLPLKRLGDYDRLCTVDGKKAVDGQFILWQSKDTSTYPCLVTASGNKAAALLNEIPLRFPLRSVDSLDGKMLTLDSAGNLSVTRLGEKNAKPFTFYSIGAMDAVFVNENNVLLCRSAILGNTPFMRVNIVTGETVPFAWPALAGLMAYRGSSGAIYVASIGQDNRQNPLTSLIRLNMQYPAQSARIAEYPGEDIQFSMAESQNKLAASIGGSGVALYSASTVQKFTRSTGLPVQLANGGEYFICLDSEGSICWHDVQTGRLLAIFRLYQGEWTLHSEHYVARGGFSN